MGIRVDTNWLSGYSKQVAEAAGELSRAAGALNATPLGPEAFGQLGRTLRTTEAYTRAAELLRGQLARAGEVLTSASGELNEVAAHYRSGEDDSTKGLRRTERS